MGKDSLASASPSNKGLSSAVTIFCQVLSLLESASHVLTSEDFKVSDGFSIVANFNVLQVESKPGLNMTKKLWICER